MTDAECKRITLERLALWGKLCHERHDTPILLVSRGLDGHAGRLAVEVCKDGPSNAEIAEMLLCASRELAPEVLAKLFHDVMQAMELFAPFIGG